MSYIRVESTVKLVQKVPYAPDYYPGMTEEEALSYERNRDLVDKLESFTEFLTSVPEDRVTYSEVVTLEQGDPS